MCVAFALVAAPRCTGGIFTRRWSDQVPRACTHAYKHRAHTRARSHTHAHIRTHSHKLTNTQTHKHTSTQTRIHAYVRTRTFCHALTHSRTHGFFSFNTFLVSCVFPLRFYDRHISRWPSCH
jgi:hypothetical protein